MERGGRVGGGDGERGGGEMEVEMERAVCPNKLPPIAVNVIVPLRYCVYTGYKSSQDYLKYCQLLPSNCTAHALLIPYTVELPSH